MKVGLDDFSDDRTARLGPPSEYFATARWLARAGRRQLERNWIRLEGVGVQVPQHGLLVDYFIDFSVGVDLKNSTTRVIDVRKGKKEMNAHISRVRGMHTWGIKHLGTCEIVRKRLTSA